MTGVASSGGSSPLRPPSPAEKASIARHLFSEHGYRDFRLSRDVHLGGRRERSQVITWDPARSRFWCERCGRGFVHLTGEVTPEMMRSAQLYDPALAPHLAGLTDKADRDEVTRLYLSGELNKEHLRALRATGVKRRAASGKRPVSDERKRRIREWMLTRFAVRGVFERVLEEALAMQEEDPDAWYAIALCRHRGESTLRRDWQDIDPKRKAKALALFERSKPQS